MKQLISLLLIVFLSVTQGLESSSKAVLITGANRGIGFALTQKYLAENYKVYAAYRSVLKSTDLIELKKYCPNLVLIQIDLLAENCSQKLQQYVGEEVFDVVIHNAGYFPYNAHKYPNFDTNDWIDAFKVNAIVPTKITAEFEQKGNLKAGTKIIFIASRRGSIKVNRQDNYFDRYGYCSSKAANISCMCQLSCSLKNKGIIVIAGHPGHVATDMTMHKGISPKESAESIFNFTNNVTIEDSGKFFDFTVGEEFK